MAEMCHMPYLKPPLFVRAVFNKIAMKFGLFGAVTLIVRGRKTGEPKSIPVIPVDHDGARYIISTRGESEWVLNLRKSGTCELSTAKGTNRFKATEVPTEKRPPLIAAYRILAGKTVDTYFTSLPDPADHPTFRLEKAD